MNQKISSWIPTYIRIPVLLILLANVCTYCGTKLITANAKHYDLTISFDHLIPFLPVFIIFYILAYAQWGFSYIFHTKQSKIACDTTVTANIIAKVLAAAFFIVLPTQTTLPQITGNNIWEQLTQMIYNADTPRNLFPSLHCLESWCCFRSSFFVKNAPKWYVPAQLVFSVLVFASTVFVKQHFVVDIFAGIIVAEIGFIIAKKKNLGSLFEIIDTRLHKSS